MSVYLGADPGLSGALATYDSVTNQVLTYDVPTFTVTRNKGQRKEIDVVQLASIVDNIATKLVIARCAFEWPNAMPKQGTASAHTFGLVTGQLHGIVVANMIPVTRVQPFVWKRWYGLNADKDAARRLASSKFPADAGQWARAKDDGRAEAALLALYACRLDMQEQGLMQ